MAQIVNYSVNNATSVHVAGLLVDGDIVDAGRCVDAGRPVTVKELVELVEPGGRLSRVIERARESVESGDSVPAAAVHLGPPVDDPDKIICFGHNYPSHAAEAGVEVPAVPAFFTKFRNSLVGATDPIALPTISDQIDYEGELAVVIGRNCHNVREAVALESIAGYSVFNDVSARDLQRRTSQWTAGKCLDTFAPMGPGMVPAAEIPDPQNLAITTQLNGEVVQEDSTASMQCGIAELISYLSSLMTLAVGDIVATGTPAGVGVSRTPPVFLRAGDLVEVSVAGVGRLANPVVDIGHPSLGSRGQGITVGRGVGRG